MARQSASSETVKSWITDYPELSFNGAELYCRVCDVSLSYSRKSAVTAHVHSKKHQYLSGGNHQKQFNADLITFMVGCNIPFNQLENPLFRSFIGSCIGGQYSDVQLLCGSTLRKDYMPQVAENIISNIRSELKGKYIWVNVTVTPNVCGWKIAYVVVGALDESQAPKARLLAPKILQDVNTDSISTLVISSLELLWGKRYNENKEKFLLFVTENEDCMKAAGRILQASFTFLHVTCLAQALHLVAEAVKESYPKVDALISSVSKVFHKAPERVQLFSKLLPTTELPPEADATRLDAWIEAATYYFINLKNVVQVLEQLDCSKAQVIATAKKAAMDPTIEGSLQEIHNSFSRIPLSMRQLGRLPRSDSVSLIDQMNVVYDLQQYISWLKGESVKRVQQKMENVLANPGFRTLSCIVKLLRQEEIEPAAPGIQESILHKYSFFRYAPVTSVDIERSFSLCKWIFSDKRRNIALSHLEQMLIIHFDSYVAK